MNITHNIPDAVVKKIIEGIMANFPEASSGCELRCKGWHYEKFLFDFEDSDGKTFRLDLSNLLEAFRLMHTDKWPKGCTQPPASAEWEAWEDWLCQSDATDFDAFAQLACIGEVIYG